MLDDNFIVNFAVQTIVGIKPSYSLIKLNVKRTIGPDNVLGISTSTLNCFTANKQSQLLKKIN